MKGVRQTHRLLHDLCDLSLNEDISDDSTQHGDSLENPDEWMHLMSQALSSRTPLQTIQRFWLLILYKKGSWRFRAGSDFLKFEQQEGALGAEVNRRPSPTLSTKDTPVRRETEMVSPWGYPRHLTLPTNTNCPSSLSSAVIG